MRNGIIVLLSIMFLTNTVFGQSEDDFSIRQSAQGTIIITGYNGTTKQVVIPGTIEGIKVTEIESGVFYEKGLTSVTIPDSITSIRASAFGSNRLTSVIIPDSVTFIGRGAFANNQLTNLTIPKNIKTFGEEGGALIGSFEGNQLTSIVIPDNVTTIGYKAFASNQLTSVTIHNGVKTIGSNAFASNLLTSVTIPDSVTDIEYMAFSGNYSLISVTIGNGVTSINSAFRDAPLAIITLPANKDNIVSVFPNNLRDFYISQGRKAGTYTWSGRLWSVGNAPVSVTLFPPSFVGTWKRDNYNNTLTFTESTLKISNQSSTWYFQKVSGNSYTIKVPVSFLGPESTATLTMELTNNNLVIDGDNGSGQDNLNGVWKKR